MSFPAGLTGSLQKLARQEGATLFMMLLAGFSAVLSRWSGQTDVVVGTSIAGRTQRETEGLIGFFVNNLALRTDLGGDPGFSELVGRVREAALGAYAHQDVPLGKLVSELAPSRDLSRQPLFQVLFTLQNAAPPTLEMPGLEVTMVPTDRVAAQFDLTLSLSETADGGLEGGLEYAADLFEAETAQ
ncbi:MAG: non-ribosomal peptide synthetase, partial [Paracoccus denitrificans]